MIRIVILGLAGLLSLQCGVQADLEWEQHEIELHPSAIDTQIKADFSFTNKGEQPVTIESVVSGCGCTTTVLEKNTYFPGEKGHIAATFNVGQRTGLQNKPINVRIRGEEKATVLRMIVHLPQPIAITPQFIYWKVGDPPQPKTVEIKVSADSPFRVTKVTSSDHTLQASLENPGTDKDYKVVVTPQQTSNPVMAILSIEVSLGPNQRKVFTAYAQIKPTLPR